MAPHSSSFLCATAFLHCCLISMWLIEPYEYGWGRSYLMQQYIVMYLVHHAWMNFYVVWLYTSSLIHSYIVTPCIVWYLASLEVWFMLLSNHSNIITIDRTNNCYHSSVFRKPYNCLDIHTTALLLHYRYAWLLWGTYYNVKLIMLKGIIIICTQIACTQFRAIQH